jgi:nucleotide-binding universal stress UspA family protein
MRSMDASNSASKIVVGVDGSAGSLEALRWAARQAQLTGASLHVVTAWAFPKHGTPFGIVFDLASIADPTTRASEALDRAIIETLGNHEQIEVRAEVISGDEAPVLLEAAQDADMLVVGNRGRGAIAGMLLGSVSEQCVRHSPCPVVVVRDHE